MLNNLWKTKALQQFPELADTIEDADTPYLLWFELFDVFGKPTCSPAMKI
jgi:hypothetical protein